MCDKCSGDLYQRDDDKIVAIENRLVVYDQQTMPLVAFYKKKGNLVEVDASGAKEDVVKLTISVLE